MSLLFGVVFSGMGIYAASQLGVLRALEENGLAPEALVGVGAGAWIAGLYACNPSAKAVQEAAREICRQGKRLIDGGGIRGWLSGGMQKRGLIRGDRIAALLEEQTGHRALGEVDVSLAIPTIALPTRKTLVFASHCPRDGEELVWTRQASVALAIRAALAAPVLVEPALWMGVPLIGAAGMHTAITALRQLAPAQALLVDAGAQRPRGKLGLWDVSALSIGAADTAHAALYPLEWRMLTPRLPENLRVTSMEALELCTEIGYEAAQEALPRIRAAIGRQQGKVLPFQQRFSQRRDVPPS